MPEQPKAPLATARPTIYIDVTVGGQRLSFDVPTAHELVREVNAALKSLNPAPKKGPARKKRPAKKQSRTKK